MLLDVKKTHATLKKGVLVEWPPLLYFMREFLKYTKCRSIPTLHRIVRLIDDKNERKLIRQNGLMILQTSYVSYLTQTFIYL